MSQPLELLPPGSPTTPAAISIGHCRRSRRNEKLAAYDEILSAYLGSFGAGGVWPVIVCAAEKPAGHAGGRGFEPLARTRGQGEAAGVREINAAGLVYAAPLRSLNTAQAALGGHGPHDSLERGRQASRYGRVPVSYQKRVENPCTECEQMNGDALKMQRNLLAGLTSG